MSSKTTVSSIHGGVTGIPLPLMAAAIIVITAVSAVLVGTQSLEVVSAIVAAGLFSAFLMTVPPSWLAFLLIVAIPFEGLITALLGGFDSSARQWFAIWKEVLLAIGIFRVLWQNTNRRKIIASNRWILIWSGFLMLVYCATFLRSPSVPAIFSLDLETRFLGVLVFFMFLDLDAKSIATLLRAMVWSVSLIALYGLIQYEWDYERLLPLMYHVPDLFADGTRRLYSYALSIFDCAYGALIAILILFAGTGRTKLRLAILHFALLVPCLLLTYVRSAYLGLLCGIVTVCIIDRRYRRRHVAIGAVALSVLCALLAFGGASVYNSSLGQRFQSIVSQTDGSSTAHKESMKTAMQTIYRNPFGIGLGKSGIIQARFGGGVDDAEFIENWLLEVAAQTGVIGAFAYLGLTGAVLLSLLRERRTRNTEVSPLRVTVGAVFVAMTVAGIMIPVWDHLLAAVYTWALVGMALGATVRSQTEPHVLDRAFYTPGLPRTGIVVNRRQFEH